MTREEAIGILKKLIEAMQGHVTVLPTSERIAAIRVAIASLETDEAYQLEYERPTTKNDLGVDYISRKDVIELVEGWWIGHTKEDDLSTEIKKMPSVYPKSEPVHARWELKQHWYSDAAYDEVAYCSHCNRNGSKTWNYCPNCGAKMVEPQESEKTETWNGIHTQITAPKGTFERIFNDADDDIDI